MKDDSYFYNFVLSYVEQYTRETHLGEINAILRDVEFYLDQAEKKAFLAWVDSVNLVPPRLGPCAPLKSAKIAFQYENSRGRTVYDRDFVMYYIGGLKCTGQSYKYSFEGSEDFWNQSLVYGVSEDLAEFDDKSKQLTDYVDDESTIEKYVFNIRYPSNNKDRAAFRFPQGFDSDGLLTIKLEDTVAQATTVTSSASRRSRRDERRRTRRSRR